MLTDYQTYTFCWKEKIMYAFAAYIVAFIFLYLFYQNLILSAVMSLVGVFFYLKVKRKKLCQVRKKTLNVQFQDAMDAMISALATGYSAPMSIIQARKDLSMLYDNNSLIMQELTYMENRLADNFRIEELFLDWGRRSGVQEILTFAQVFETAQQSGGNLVNIMRQTSTNIHANIEIMREIDVLIAGKKMENNCMLVVPLGIIVYMLLFSPGFLDPLYHNLFGYLFMTGALALYLTAFFLAQNIMKIEL